MNEIIKSKKFKTAAIIVGVILCAMIIFALGISVGTHKGRYSCNFGKNYERNFMGQFGERDGRGLMQGFGMMDRFEGKGLRNAHGLSGVIISITDNKIVIKNKNNQENTIAVIDKTLIKSQRNDLQISDLKTGDEIVVMGKPDESGVVNADLIRVFVGGLIDSNANDVPQDNNSVNNYTN